MNFDNIPVVAYGYENTRPTERAALMIVKLENASDQYPDLAVPLVRLSDVRAELSRQASQNRVCGYLVADGELCRKCGKRHAAAQSQPLVEPIADYPPHLADEVERELALMIDRSPEPLRRLSDWLANKLDEDDWKTAERMLLGAVESVADRVQQHQVKKGEPS